MPQASKKNRTDEQHPLLKQAAEHQARIARDPEVQAKLRAAAKSVRREMMPVLIICLVFNAVIWAFSPALGLWGYPTAIFLFASSSALVSWAMLGGSVRSS